MVVCYPDGRLLSQRWLDWKVLLAGGLELLLSPTAFPAKYTKAVQVRRGRWLGPGPKNRAQQKQGARPSSLTAKSAPATLGGGGGFFHSPEAQMGSGAHPLKRGPLPVRHPSHIGEGGGVTPYVIQLEQRERGVGGLAP